MIFFSKLKLGLILAVVTLTVACSSAPSEVAFDNRAKTLSDDQHSQLRVLQDQYRQRCQGALAIITVENITLSEPGAHVDDEFRQLMWPEWAESSTPKALIYYSRAPQLLQTRLSNRWMSLNDITNLRESISHQVNPLLQQQRAATILGADCPRPVQQGWIKRKFYDFLAAEREIIDDYAYPKPRWYSQWYYTLALNPLLNGCLLALNLFNYSPWVLFLFPLAVVVCLPKLS